MRSMTVLYDQACALCVRCRAWLEGQEQLVPLDFVACQSREAQDRYGAVPWLGEELVVVSDEGAVWAGPAAFLMCLWALKDWREWSWRLSGPELVPLAERFFHAISSRRGRIAAILRPDPCKDGVCRVPGAHRPRTAYR
jgi:predicted DCC family thiol-disulfide oxidoreductase YuxK